METIRTRVVEEAGRRRMEVEVDGAGWLPVPGEQKPYPLAHGFVYVDDEALPDVQILVDPDGRPMKLRGFVRSFGLADRCERLADGRDDPDLVAGGEPVAVADDPSAGE